MLMIILDIGGIKMKNFRDSLNEKMKNPEFVNENINVNSNGVITMDDPSFGTYFIKIDSMQVDAVCVRNALSKAVRDAIYGDFGILTNLNNGNKLNVNTDF